MSFIKLEDIKKSNNKVSYSFITSEDLKKYFSGKEFWIEYEESIESVPNSILSVPFICNVLPLIWLSDSELYVKEVDEDFYSCISNVKKGYERVFSNVVFAGKIHAEGIQKIANINNRKSAMFFSGGLDSYQTLISHMNEKPLLLSIWGSDIKVDNKDGWGKLNSILINAAQKYNFPIAFIKSSFREFDSEGHLDEEYHSIVGDSWWHGIKHGLGLLGHVAPLAFIHSISTMYIASTNWIEQGVQKCASSPYIDNFVRFCGCQVIHDGFQYSRQDKVHNIVEYSKNSKDYPQLHVCWERQTGDNCCHCEKCYRMMAGLFAEGAEPRKFGFNYSVNDLINMEKNLYDFFHKDTVETYWPDIQNAFRKNNRRICTLPNYKWYKWILYWNFYDLGNTKIKFSSRMRRKLYLIMKDNKLH